MQACRLSATEIACRRGDRVLFRKLSLNLTAGDALHISGPNGIGKSSLIRILAGLLRPYAGQIASSGAIALLDERSALDSQVSLQSALDFWAGIDRAGAPEEPAILLGIDDLLDVPFRYLSTGQRKRAAFARLLNQNASLWLLDEPLNGLDTEAQERITAMIKLHCTAGGICIAASHQPITLPGSATLNLEDFAL